MKDLLVGSTGFVGGNLMAKHSFVHQCHSSDVMNYYDSSPDLCVYSGVPAAMFLANRNPESDLEIMRAAMQNIRRIAPKKLVLISTIAVYHDSRGKSENDATLTPDMPAYGYNRLLLEQWVRAEYSDAFIVRLPALYGMGLKKNFLYDLQTLTPSMLRVDKYAELAAECSLVKDGYSYDSASGFYKLNGQVDAARLKIWYREQSFNALSFTDSRSIFQFYNLGRLWDDIIKGLDAGLNCLNLTPEPVSAAEVYRAVTGKSGWANELSAPPFHYDLRSAYAEILGGTAEGYLCSRETVLEDIKAFMNQPSKR